MEIDFYEAMAAVGLPVLTLPEPHTGTPRVVIDLPSIERQANLLRFLAGLMTSLSTEEAADLRAAATLLDAIAAGLQGDTP